MYEIFVNCPMSYEDPKAEIYRYLGKLAGIRNLELAVHIHEDSLGSWLDEKFHDVEMS